MIRQSILINVSMDYWTFLFAAHSWLLSAVPLSLLAKIDCLIVYIMLLQWVAISVHS